MINVGEYLEYHGDIMSTVGVILSTVRDSKIGLLVQTTTFRTTFVVRQRSR